ncbi:CoA transferase [Streptomyces sp. NPDC050121]|uniref:CoA transferase n=1 Tax=Streptomyces sp. NPDC050121 TaxID=3365601 RepID=UPI00378F5053
MATAIQVGTSRSHAMTATGPLRGVRVLELASLAPAPFACTMLSDLGAEVLRIDPTDTPARDGAAQGPFGPRPPLGRHRPHGRPWSRGAGAWGRRCGGTGGWWGPGATGRRGDRVADSWVGKTWRERRRQSG